MELLGPTGLNYLVIYSMSIDVANCRSISILVTAYPACSDDQATHPKVNILKTN
jgi:hypothetical protein